jgi:hypothetical protein
MESLPLHERLSQAGHGGQRKTWWGEKTSKTSAGLKKYIAVLKEYFVFF